MPLGWPDQYVEQRTLYRVERLFATDRVDHDKEVLIKKNWETALLYRLQRNQLRRRLARLKSKVRTTMLSVGTPGKAATQRAHHRRRLSRSLSNSAAANVTRNAATWESHPIAIDSHYQQHFIFG